MSKSVSVRRRRHSEEGFTLIEVCIAMMMVGMVLLGMVFMMDAIIPDRESSLKDEIALVDAEIKSLMIEYPTASVSSFQRLPGAPVELTITVPGKSPEASVVRLGEGSTSIIKVGTYSSEGFKAGEAARGAYAVSGVPEAKNNFQKKREEKRTMIYDGVTGKFLD